MKLIIAGSRTITVTDIFLNSLVCHFGVGIISEVVCGMEPKGIDASGLRWAQRRNHRLKEFPPDWKQYGDSAGPIRNGKMADYADALLLIWDGQSKGASSMKGHMKYKKVYECILREIN